MLGFVDVEKARARLAGVLRPTPAVTSAYLSERVGRPVFTKPEHLQRTGSFKIRGAYNHISALAAEGKIHEVVAASAGNHAQGVALAAALVGLPATVYMPTGTSLPKIEATRSYGAEVVIGLDTLDDCLEAARVCAVDRSASFVPPFDDPLVVAGQGTIGLEIAEEVPEADTVVVPIGGGGLIGGIGLALATARPGTKVIGVEAAGATAMLAALAEHRPVRLGSTRTMADGIAIRSVSQLTLDLTTSYVEEVVTVDEEDISRALLLLLERSKWVVEPAGAVAVAALLSGKVPGDSPVLALLSGGNVDPVVLERLIEHGLGAAGRYLQVRVRVDDRPGSLAALTAEVARVGLNVLGVEHHRVAPGLGVNEVIVVLSLECRDRAHRDEVVPALRAAGFSADAVS